MEPHEAVASQTQKQSTDGWIDLHCHYAPRSFPRLAAEKLGAEIAIVEDADEEDILIRYGNRIPFRKGELARMLSLDDRIATMDEVGTAVQVLSPPTFFAFYEQPPEIAAYLCAALNDGMQEAAAAHPDRLLAMVTLPLQDAETAIRELERTWENPVVKGVIVGSSVDGRELDDPSILPFWEAAALLGVPIFLHPSSFDLVGGDRMREFFLNNLVGNPTNTTLAASRLLFSGVLEQFSDLHICLAHAGGYLAPATGRLTRGYATHPAPRQHLRQSPDGLVHRFYIDTIAHSLPMLQLVLATFGEDRLVCGSDYPFDIGDWDPRAAVETLAAAPELRGAIARDNARRFLRMDEP